MKETAAEKDRQRETRKTDRETGNRRGVYVVATNFTASTAPMPGVMSTSSRPPLKKGEAKRERERERRERERKRQGKTARNRGGGDVVATHITAATVPKPSHAHLIIIRVLLLNKKSNR